MLLHLPTWRASDLSKCRHELIGISKLACPIVAELFWSYMVLLASENMHMCRTQPLILAVAWSLFEARSSSSKHFWLVH